MFFEGKACEVRLALEQIYRDESRRIFASLLRLLRDFDLADEALQEAFAAATTDWEKTGIPSNPRAWLISTGRFKAIDAMRRQQRFDRAAGRIAHRSDQVADWNANRADEEIEDDRLRLIFTCCHPAIDPKIQVALTLREVCGLETEQVASAFLTSTATMAQRIVRGKAKIREAKIPIVVPHASEIQERLESVLAVIYLIYNEGYAASSGDLLTRADLSSEAIRLARLLVELMPDPEAIGLLALMLLHDSRRNARTTNEGDLILLEDQDRSLWDSNKIDEGKKLIERSFQSRQFGIYTIQAAIAAVHASTTVAKETDWEEIVGLYGALLAINPSPVIELNQAVAIAMRDGPETGIARIDEIMAGGELADYHLAHASKADLFRRIGRHREARESYHRALELAKQEPERRFLMERLSQLP